MDAFWTWFSYDDLQDSNVSSSTHPASTQSRGLKRKLSSEMVDWYDAKYENDRWIEEWVSSDEWFDWHWYGYIHRWCDTDTICPCNGDACPQVGSTSSRKWKLPCYQFNMETAVGNVPDCHDNLCCFISCVNDPYYDVMTIWFI